MTAPWPQPDLAAVRAALRVSLPDTVGLAVLDPRHTRAGIGAGLYPEEEAVIARAIAKRRREFAAGRIAAREAMAGVGMLPAPIPMGSDRAPVWPADLTGSISHCETTCIAAVARTTEIHGIGVDVEENTALNRQLWGEICRSDELVWLESQPARERGYLVKRIFSLKEAVYKAVYPLHGEMLEFTDVRLNWGPRGCAAHVLPDRDRAGRDYDLSVTSRAVGDQIVSTAVVSR